MGKTRVAINGFGRIGRLTFRNLVRRNNVEIVAINDLSPNSMLAHLANYDSAHGKFEHEVTADDHHLYVNGNTIIATAERDPLKLPWKENNIDVVLECTGIFRTKDAMNKHIEAGAKKVLLSAPSKDGSTKTIVLGVNDDLLTSEDLFVSNASCTTNCLAPMMKVLQDNFGIAQGSMTTTHAYTADQRIQDGSHSDLRRARAAAYNIVPTTTGAATAVGKVIPEVAGKLFSMAMRVPVITGSLVELNVMMESDVSIESVNAAFKRFSEAHSNVLQYETAPIVSSDIVTNTHSCIFDSMLTNVEGRFLKVVAWYDNEAGYSARMADMTAMM